MVHPDIHPHHAGKCNYNKYLLLLDLSPNPTLTQMSELRCQFLFVILSALLLLNVFFSTHVFFFYLWWMIVVNEGLFTVALFHIDIGV